MAETGRKTRDPKGGPAAPGPPPTPTAQETAAPDRADTERRCTRCAVVTDSDHCPRCGRWTLHNTGSVSTALDAHEVPDFAQVELERFHAGALVDEGEEPPTRRRSLVQYRSLLHRNIVLVAHALREKGLYDRRGKMRIGWLGKLESLISTCVSIDRLLGLERRPRGVGPDDLSAYLAEQGQED